MDTFRIAQPGDLVIVDVETSGLDPRRHEILEYGALRLDPVSLSVRSSFELKAWPQFPERVDPRAAEVNGYTKAAWQDSVSQKSAARQFAAFAEGSRVLGWNVTFDWNFLDATFDRYGLKPVLDYHRFDIMSLYWFSRGGVQQGLSLKSACTALGIDPEPDVHSALEGASRAYAVLLKLAWDSGAWPVVKDRLSYG